MRIIASLLVLVSMAGVSADCTFKLPLNCGCTQADFDLMFTLLDRGMTSNNGRYLEEASSSSEVASSKEKTANLRGAQDPRELYECGLCVTNPTLVDCRYCPKRRNMEELVNDNNPSKEIEGQNGKDGSLRDLQSNSDTTKGRLVSTLAKLKWGSCNPNLAFDITCNA